jgi:hypothetical protein
MGIALIANHWSARTEHCLAGEGAVEPLAGNRADLGPRPVAAAPLQVCGHLVGAIGLLKYNGIGIIILINQESAVLFGQRYAYNQKRNLAADSLQMQRRAGGHLIFNCSRARRRVIAAQDGDKRSNAIRAIGSP